MASIAPWNQFQCITLYHDQQGPTWSGFFVPLQPFLQFPPFSLWSSYTGFLSMCGKHKLIPRSPSCSLCLSRSSHGWLLLILPISAETWLPSRDFLCPFPLKLWLPSNSLAHHLFSLLVKLITMYNHPGCLIVSFFVSPHLALERQELCLSY